MVGNLQLKSIRDVQETIVSDDFYLVVLLVFNCRLTKKSPILRVEFQPELVVIRNLSPSSKIYGCIRITTAQGSQPSSSIRLFPMVRIENHRRIFCVEGRVSKCKVKFSTWIDKWFSFTVLVLLKLILN